MFNNMIQKIALLCLLFVINLNSFAYSEALNGSIKGRIINSTTKQPILGITVLVEGTKLGAYSKADGSFIIKNIPVGVYTIRFSGVGYQTYIKSDVMISNIKELNIEIELIEKVIELKGTEVRGNYFLKKTETISSSQILNAEDIRRAPGVQEDVIRAVALLPGVGVTQAGRNDLTVRGGSPFENLFIVDNIEIPNINHFGSQGASGGPLSIVNLDFVKDVNFSAGAFGAKYGDKLSSMMNIALRNGSQERIMGTANLSATGFGISAEGPIKENSSFLVGVRRSYLDFIFKSAGFSFIPEYWDFFGKANYKVDNSNQLSFLVIGAIGTVSLNNDDSENKFDNSRVTIPNQTQYFTGLTWKSVFSSGYSTVTIGRSYTSYSTYQNDSNLVEVFKNNSIEGENIIKSDFDFILSKNFDIMFGNQLKFAPDLDYEIKIPGYLRLNDISDTIPLMVDTNFSIYKNSTYSALTLGLNQLKFILGMRADYYSFTESKWYFSPRLSAQYQLSQSSLITLSGGRYYQAPSYIWLVGGSTQKLKAIQADQIVLGYEYTPIEYVKIQVEMFYKKYNDYPARVWRPEAVLSPSGFDDISSDIPFGLEPLSSVGEGYSRGIEFFVQKKLNEIPFYGLLSFSYNQTVFKSIAGNEHPGSFDTEMIFNLSMGYKFSYDLELSGKFRVATGLPTTPFITSGASIGSLDYSKYNEGERLPIFHALDLRLDKKWNFSSMQLTTYIDIQNIYGRKNISRVRWNARTQSPEYSESIGILPSIGIKLEI